VSNNQNSENFVPKDTVVVFKGEDLLYLDFEFDTWDSGEIEPIGDQALEVGENCAITRVDLLTDKSTVIITGGVLQSGLMLNWAYGLRFRMQDGNLRGYMTQGEPKMILPQPRMMHQSCIVKDKNGDPLLLLIGGKVGETPF
jgi:hypothetical protein